MYSMLEVLSVAAVDQVIVAHSVLKYTFFGVCL